MGSLMKAEMVTPHNRLVQSALPELFIVADCYTTYRPLQAVFQNYYRVTCAQNSEAALSKLETHRPDAIVIDLNLKGMDSIALLKAIRDDEQTAEIPVILAAPASESAGLAYALRMGANDYITKPFDVEVVWARVGAQLALKQAMDARERAIVELEQDQEAHTRLFRMAMHDIKIPMTNIRIAESMLRRQLAAASENMDVLDSMMMSLDAMQEVIDGFMGAFNLREPLELELSEVSAERVIQQAMIQHSLSAVKKEITLSLEQCSGVALADPTRLSQVIGNLLSNAIKYSPPGSEVRVWSEVSDDGCVRFCVADEGPGIPQNERHLLFTQFGRLSTRPTGQETSTGLGLWIVKMLVTAMNGTVDVDGSPGGGSVFWVRLPTAKSDTQDCGPDRMVV